MHRLCASAGRQRSQATVIALVKDESSQEKWIHHSFCSGQLARESLIFEGAQSLIWLTVAALERATSSKSPGKHMPRFVCEGRNYTARKRRIFEGEPGLWWMHRKRWVVSLALGVSGKIGIFQHLGIGATFVAAQEVFCTLISFNNDLRADQEVWIPNLIKFVDQHGFSWDNLL